MVPDLIGSGALCELAAVIVEWHDANPYLKLPVEQLHSIELAHAKMRRAVADGGVCEGGAAAPILFDVDDETYPNDNQPWPEGSVCARD